MPPFASRLGSARRRMMKVCRSPVVATSLWRSSANCSLFQSLICPARALTLNWCTNSPDADFSAAAEARRPPDGAASTRRRPRIVLSEFGAKKAPVNRSPSNKCWQSPISRYRPGALPRRGWCAWIVGFARCR